MRVAALRGRWTTRHPARPTATALAQQKEWGRRVREDGLYFECGIEPLYYSQVCAMKSQFRMRLWELQLKKAAGTIWFKNWMYGLVVIMVRFHVVNSWIKRGKYWTLAPVCFSRQRALFEELRSCLSEENVCSISIGGGSGLSFFFLRDVFVKEKVMVRCLHFLRTTWRVCIICSYSSLEVILVRYFIVLILILCS
jgi:hypothetical protein